MIQERTQQLQLVHDRFLKPTPAPRRAPAPSHDLPLSDDEIISKAHAAKNGMAFGALWNGDTTGYNSPSEADLALCNMLAFWCQCDAARMDSLFRQSGMMRKKWDRRQSGSTYGALTIQEAIRRCSNVYDPNHKKVAKVVTAPGDATMKPTDFTDTGNAKSFAQRYRGNAMYSSSIGWLIETGTVWEENDLAAVGLGIDSTDIMINEAYEEYKKASESFTSAKIGDDEQEIDRAKKAVKAAEAYINHAKRSRNQPKISAMLKLAQALMYVKPDKLDANPYILNTPAGMVDLRTKAVLPYSSTEYCTKITSCAPGEQGREMWLDFLDTISCGDEKMVGFLQQVAGMSAVGKVFEENLILAIGDGRNGKSAFFNALATVFGSYAGTIASEVLTTSGRSKGAELANLKGKRLVIAAETEEGARLSASMLKQIASTDKIHAERKYKDPEDFIPSHSTILYTNHLPRVGSTDTGTWRRLVLIPFDAKIAATKEVKNYADVLATKAGPAILSWVIEGAYNYISIGHKLVIPEFVHMAIEQYQNENDWMSEFLEEFCEVGQSRSVKARPLYTAYHDWATIAHGYVRRSDDFAAELEKQGFQKRKTKQGMMWHGVSLLPQDVCRGYRNYG